MTTMTMADRGRALAHSTEKSTVQRILLTCGILAPLLYISADIILGLQYEGYSFRSQAISELSAIGAPTRDWWAVMGFVWTLLIIAFAIGVLRMSLANRPLRTTGWLLFALGVSGFLWAFFPMHTRGAERTWQDVGHIVLSAGSVLLILAFIGFGAFALGRLFRLYSFVTMLALVVAGGVTFAWAGRIAAGEPTPWLGAVERVNIYGYLIWIGVLAAALMRGAPRSLRPR